MVAGRSNAPQDFFTTSEQEQITQCIQNAETRTAAEIRVRLERRCENDPLSHCRELLEKLGMTQTQGRSGLLIYLSLEDRKVAIYGDTAIDAVVGNKGWIVMCDQLRERFASGDFATAICDTIQSLTELLAARFPARELNPNELPDEPSLGE